MPPERSKQLVYELDAWYRSHTVRQKDLAAALELSPQGLNEILALRNRPSGETALRIVEFLKSKNMTTDKPKTLTAALDQIEALTAELAQLKAGKATTPTGTVQMPPAVTATLPIAPKPPAPLPVAPPAATNSRGTEMVFNPGPPLSEMTEIDRLRVELNAEKDQTKRQVLYRKIKAAEAERRGPQRVSRLHGV
jgi:hypothetical protein